MNHGLFELRIVSTSELGPFHELYLGQFPEWHSTMDHDLVYRPISLSLINFNFFFLYVFP